MEFSALFLAVTVVMIVAWWGTRTLALALFAAVAITALAAMLLFDQQFNEPPLTATVTS
jgi:hypothetical protein